MIRSRDAWRARDAGIWTGIWRVCAKCSTARRTASRGRTSAGSYARLALLLQVEVPFLVGKPLIHFVARGGCAAFRTMLGALGPTDGQDLVALRLRARRGGSTFPAEARARVVARSPLRIVWTIRPCNDARATLVARETSEAGATSIDAPASLGDLLRASANAVRGAANVRRVALVEAELVDSSIAVDRIAYTRVALDQLARTALHLAPDDGEIRVSAEAIDDGSVLVAFGETAARICTVRSATKSKRA